MVYILALVTIIVLGLYAEIKNTGFGGTIYGRFGSGGTKLAYGPFQYFMIAGILLAGGAFFWIINKIGSNK